MGEINGKKIENILSCNIHYPPATANQILHDPPIKLPDMPFFVRLKQLHKVSRGPKYVMLFMRDGKVGKMLILPSNLGNHNVNNQPRGKFGPQHVDEYTEKYCHDNKVMVQVKFPPNYTPEVIWVNKTPPPMHAVQPPPQTVALPSAPGVTAKPPLAANQILHDPPMELPDRPFFVRLKQLHKVSRGPKYVMLFMRDGKVGKMLILPSNLGNHNVNNQPRGKFGPQHVDEYTEKYCHDNKVMVQVKFPPNYTPEVIWVNKTPPPMHAVQPPPQTVALPAVTAEPQLEKGFKGFVRCCRIIRDYDKGKYVLTFQHMGVTGRMEVMFKNLGVHNVNDNPLELLELEHVERFTAAFCEKNKVMLQIRLPDTFTPSVQWL